MSSQIEDGGPAFPHVDVCPDTGKVTNYSGMTLRDWFAGQAMRVLLEDPKTRIPQDYIAMNAYYMADAMLVARKEVA